MSTRAIAPIVGVHDTTVMRDLRSPAANAAPAPEVPPAVTTRAFQAATVTPPFDPATGEVLDDQPETQPITGMDGKTYTRPNRPPVPRSAPRTDVVLEINKTLDAAEQAAEHANRITRAHLANRHGEATVWTRRLSAALETLERLNTSLQEASL